MTAANAGRLEDLAAANPATVTSGVITCWDENVLDELIKADISPALFL